MSGQVYDVRRSGSTVWVRLMGGKRGENYAREVAANSLKDHEHMVLRERQGVTFYVFTVLPKPDAIVKVIYKGAEHVFALDGEELSVTMQHDGTEHKYLTNASKDYIATEVEKALKLLTQ